ncbi:MAG TPA: alpha-amylase family glycosyl hydrolase, partial [bacterium]|nr:alpha-amylase family glycosyl hydrolase [bacterium]
YSPERGSTIGSTNCNIRIRHALAAALLLLAAPAGAGELGPVWYPRVTLARSPHPRRAIDWSQENLYLILVDRFYNGCPANDFGRNPASFCRFDSARNNFSALKYYQGGDLQGVIDKLDYLQDLGVTTLWLSPLFDNSDSAFVGWWPYHGYHPIDFFKVDEHFGDIATLRRLITLAHRRGMKVLLDMIFNHVAPDHPWVARKELWEGEGYRYWFHPHSGTDASTSIVNWQDQQQLETCELNGLPDLAQENPHVYDFLLDMAKFWIVESGCDGFRLDAVKHIPKSFWERICRDLHAFAGPDFLLLGEVFAGETPYVAGYQELGFNALFDIPLYYTLNRVFAQGGSFTLLSRQTALNRQWYHDLLLSQVLDNHDVARFSYWADGHAREKMSAALTYTLVQHGLPMLYYGNEVALEGAAATNEQTGAGQDYLNRLPMPWPRVTGSDRALVRHTRRLLHLRARLAALRSDSLVEIYQDYGVYAFVKYEPKEAILVVLSNSSAPEERRLPLPPGLFSAQTRFEDQLSPLRIKPDADGLSLRLKPWASHLFRIKGYWNRRLLRTLDWACQFTPRISSDMAWVTFRYLGDA